MSIDPASQEVFLEDTATTDVLVEDVTDLYGFEFQLTFDSALVEGVQVQPGDFLSPDWILENSVDNDNGTIDYALCQRSPSEPRSGDGVLATITWRGEAEGISPVHFNYVKLGAPGPVPIPADTQDGEITVCLLGDFDCNCIIELSDIMEVASRWRTSCDIPDPDDDPDTPNYDAFYDVNKDCVINIVDIMQIAARWGDTCGAE